MAKVSIVERNKKRERLVKKYSNRRQDLKKITSNRELPIEERFVAGAKLAQLPRNGARNRVKLRCELTGRSRGNYRKFKLCRIALRELALSGKLPGVIKASW